MPPASKVDIQIECSDAYSKVDETCSDANSTTPASKVDIQIETCSDANSTTPASKVETIGTEQTQENDATGYRFMDRDILKIMFSCLACPECFRQKIIIEEKK